MFVSSRFPLLLVAALTILALPTVAARPVPAYQRAGNRRDWQPYGPANPDHSYGSGDEVPTFTFNELWDMQNAFYTQFMYPNNVAQAKSINSTLLAPNVKGRVDITRTFDGPELNTEYLFGLFAQLALNPNATTLLGVPLNYTIVHFAANQNIASASTIITFEFASLGITLPVEIDTWNVFNAQGQVLEYDATFRWFQYLLDTLVVTVMQAGGFASPTQVVEYFTSALAQSICQVHQSYCNGANQQYANYSACYDYLTTKVRFGQAYELGMNTLLCRMIHENMVPYRPSVHCPHIGPTGGGFCTDDLTYLGVVTEPYFTNQPMVPCGYENSNATIAAM